MFRITQSGASVRLGMTDNAGFIEVGDCVAGEQWRANPVSTLYRWNAIECRDAANTIIVSRDPVVVAPPNDNRSPWYTLPQVGDAAAMGWGALAVVPSAGVALGTRNVGGGAAFLGAVSARMGVLSWAIGEVGVGYQEANYGLNGLTVRTVPVTGSFWVALSPSEVACGYIGIGTGAYVSTVSRAALSASDRRSRTVLGGHLGGGMSFRTSETVTFDFQLRYVVLGRRSLGGVGDLQDAFLSISAGLVLNVPGNRSKSLR
jgi:hypothetical protein